ncbi:ABC transporter permease [Acuticoccus mangrovi]|uniref:ABC transporter permease n=1 Tax=Acuticoccus mangrovi TaxID=2796142 RepID=A0A934MDU4_9HYPH|nr:ABC transporter permease [Acuticoccus mangrovi]MBJ3776757.1 ABC transporter permease [Acuticoccus mangrovi]
MAEASVDLEAAPIAPRRRARRRPLPSSLVAGGLVFAAIILVAIFAPLIAPYPFDEMHIRDRFHAPSLTYLAGTDEYGRDVFSRMIYGARLSLFMGVLATLVSLVIGVPLGLLSGYMRGAVDEAVMRILDIMMAFPPIMLVLLIITLTEPSLWKTSVAVGFLFVPAIARLMRSVCLDLAGEEYVLAARARGEGASYILLREILPNAWPPIIVEGSLRVTFAILLAAVLSFLGFGIQPPAADWGLMIAQARGYIERAPWIVLAPGLAMCVTVVAVNLFGDGLREYLDPRMSARRG